MVERYRASHEVRVFTRATRDRNDLNAALMIYARNTAPFHRTQANQIQDKLENPNNPNGTYYVAGLYQDGQVVGLVMFGYYPRCRVVVVDHMVIDAPCRKHGSFYVFSALLQQCIEDLCSDYDFVVVELGMDREFVEDGGGGPKLVKVLRQLGFGRVHVKYLLPNLQPRKYRRSYRGALMLRGPQKVAQLRAEDLADIHDTILYEHYLPWLKDYFGEFVPEYESQLRKLKEDMLRQIENQPTVVVNGSNEDELAGRPSRSPKQVLGVPIRIAGHLSLFVLLTAATTSVGWLFDLRGQLLLLFLIVGVLCYAGVVAISQARALQVFEKLGNVLFRAISGR